MAINNGMCTIEGFEYVKGWETINSYPVNNDVKKNHLQVATAALSFQLMTCAEPPELVIATIQSLLSIKKDCDEIIIIDNNNTDTSM